MPPPAPHGRAFATLLTNHPKKKPSPRSNSFKTLNPRPKTSPKPDPKPPEPVYMRSTIHKISSILRYSPWEDAQAELRRLPVRWDSFTVNRVLKTHPPMEKAWLFFNWAARLPGFKHDQFTYTTILDIFGEAGRMSSMWHMFDEMHEKGIAIDVATYTSLMHWLSKDGDLEGAVRAWDEMMRRGCRPTIVSYTALMKILFDHDKPKEAAAVYREILEVGLTPNCHTYTVLMEYLAGAGKFKAALEVMSKMQEAGVQPDKATCNILVQKCSKAGETSAMTQILQYMKEHSIVLRHAVYLEALEALKINGESDHLLQEVNPHLSFEGIEDDMDSEPSGTETASLIDRGIILNLLARQNLIAIELVLSEMTNKDIKMDSELISAVVQSSCANCRPSCAVAAFNYCLKMRKNLDRSAYASLLGLFIRINAFEKVLGIVEEMMKASTSFGTYLVSLLIYKLGCAGLSASAMKIFYSLPMDQNVVTYTALMDAYFQAGEVDKSLELFADMKRKGIPISFGTYDVLIVGLERAGRTSDAAVYRIEKRRFQWHEHSRQGVSTEECLCNCLFGTDGG
ncbi:pentatricopeptide repeat-containing protein [Cocos nucifera]|uniref:Pentatricopeptide repeat-containing protein n=1 Tax=Cocos nucifera TaxID=13894 RepID=A0A8K0ITB3_COCNU|nr:pentatricopeptide repeat-containing protein [Cocos nucifera]